MSTWLPVPLFLLLMMVVVAVVFGNKRDRVKAPTRWTVSARELMNSTEKRFFRRLEETFPDLTVLSQVALSQLVAVAEGKAHWSLRASIDRKVVDFVLCDADLRVIACIEIDGPAHRRLKQKRRDADKTAALSAAGYKLLRFSTDQLPSAQDLKVAIAWRPSRISSETSETALDSAVSFGRDAPQA